MSEILTVKRIEAAVSVTNKLAEENTRLRAELAAAHEALSDMSTTYAKVRSDPPGAGLEVVREGLVDKLRAELAAERELLGATKELFMQMKWERDAALAALEKAREAVSNISDWSFSTKDAAAPAISTMITDINRCRAALAAIDAVVREKHD